MTDHMLVSEGCVFSLKIRNKVVGFFFSFALTSTLSYFIIFWVIFILVKLL